MEWFIGVIVVLVVGGVVAALSISSDSQKFVQMGDITGKTTAEIIAVVGPPSSISGMADGGQLLQWMKTNSAGGYHYAIAFDAEGKAVGYTHQWAQ